MKELIEIVKEIEKRNGTYFTSKQIYEAMGGKLKLTQIEAVLFDLRHQLKRKYKIRNLSTNELTDMNITEIKDFDTISRILKFLNVENYDLEEYFYY